MKLICHLVHSASSCLTYHSNAHQRASSLQSPPTSHHPYHPPFRRHHPHLTPTAFTNSAPFTSTLLQPASAISNPPLFQLPHHLFPVALMSDAVLFADEEKAGPASVPVAESAVVVGAKKEEEFRNYKNSKRQAVSRTCNTALYASRGEWWPRPSWSLIVFLRPLWLFPCRCACRLSRSFTVCSTRIRLTTSSAPWRRSHYTECTPKRSHRPAHCHRCRLSSPASSSHTSTHTSLPPNPTFFILCSQISVAQPLRDVHLGLPPLPRQGEPK